jgi:carbon monoxide dehydrogenase subunit G
MEITGNYLFDADQETVWTLLMNPDAIAKALPGVQEMVPIEGETNAWRAAAKIGIASVSGTYTGIVRITEMSPPNTYRLTVGGEGQQSVINGTALMTLTYDPEQKKTIVSWDAEANISGKLASIAQRLVKAAAGLMSKQFFGALAKQLPTPNADQPT